MKKILLSTAIASSLLLAGDQNYIEIGGGAINSKDNFSTESNKNISSLENAESESAGIPYVSFYYGYDINEAVNIYATSEMGDLNLGSSFETDYGFFDIGLKANTGEEWKNPFLTGSNRVKTDTSEFGAYLGYGFALSENSESMIRYEFSKKTYEKDDVIKDLKREGNRHILSLENVYMTNLFNKNSALLSNFTYEKYDAEGEASSYNKYNLDLGISTEVIEDVEFTLIGSIGKKKFEKINPSVSKKVDVDIYGVHGIVTWDKPFGYENIYSSLKTGYEKEEANHNFYDKENTYGLISVGYKF